MIAVKILLAILDRRLPRHENPNMPAAVSYVVLTIVLGLLATTLYFLVAK